MYFCYFCENSFYDGQRISYTLNAQTLNYLAQSFFTLKQ